MECADRRSLYPASSVMHVRNNGRMKTPVENRKSVQGEQTLCQVFRRKFFIIRGWLELAQACVKLSAVFKK